MPRKKTKTFIPNKYKSRKNESSDDSESDTSYESDDLYNSDVTDSDTNSTTSSETNSTTNSETNSDTTCTCNSNTSSESDNSKKHRIKKSISVGKHIGRGSSESDSSGDLKKSISYEKHLNYSTPNIIKDKKNSSNNIFKELIKNQLHNVPIKWKLNINDMKRICEHIDTSIFDEKKCCTWKGYVTNINNPNKGTYINFYFKNKKVALHRLLYSNFVEPLNDDEYLKFSCDNKGVCCNINHYEKYKYTKKNNNSDSVKKEKKEKEKKDCIISFESKAKNVYIDFDW